MKVLSVLWIYAAAVAFILTAANIGCEKDNSPPHEGKRELQNVQGNRANLDLDERSAIQIAEAALIDVYGAIVLRQRPWVIQKEDGLFRIHGTFYGPGVGGVAMVTIDRATGEVLQMSHGK